MLYPRVFRLVSRVQIRVCDLVSPLGQRRSNRRALVRACSLGDLLTLADSLTIFHFRDAVDRKLNS